MKVIHNCKIDPEYFAPIAACADTFEMDDENLEPHMYCLITVFVAS
jgi:hypothetical protein